MTFQPFTSIYPRLFLVDLLDDIIGHVLGINTAVQIEQLTLDHQLI